MAITVALVSAWVLIGAAQAPSDDGPITLDPSTQQEQQQERPASFRGRTPR